MDIRKYFKPLPFDTNTEFKSKVFTLDDECWIEQGYLPTNLKEIYNFDDLWRLHPEEYGTVSYGGKVVRTPRWQQTYLKDYYFSGCVHKALPLPPQFQPFYDWADTIAYDNMKFNQVLVNWYANGNHYINRHADNELQLVRKSSIFISFFGSRKNFSYQG